MSARENTLTILADAKDFTTCGVLGIDTYDMLYNEKNSKMMSYQEVLEKIFVLQEYENKKISVEMGKPCGYYYAEHFDIIARSNQDALYYDVLKARKYAHKLDWILYRLDWMIKILWRKNRGRKKGSYGC